MERTPEEIAAQKRWEDPKFRAACVKAQIALGYRNYPTKDEMCTQCGERKKSGVKDICLRCYEKTQVLI